MKEGSDAETIRQLFSRKEAYKAAAIKHYRKVQDLEFELNQANRTIDLLRKKHRKEVAMRKWWKNAFWIMSGGILMVAITAILIIQIMSVKQSQDPPQDPLRMPTSGFTQRSGNHILASVNIINGSTQGSGVVISKGEKHSLVLSAAHLFSGKVGGNFWVYYPDGTYAKATLLAIDTERDLSLSRVDPDTILTYSHIPEAIFTGELSGVGYTNGQGPNYRKVVYNKNYYNKANKFMWDFSVTSGPFWDGDSGSAVFIDDACVGIVTERDKVPSNPNLKKLYACSHFEILNFLKTETAKLDGFGNYNQKPEVPAGAEEAPPLWRPTPNVPVFVENRTDRMVAEMRAELNELRKGSTRRPSEIPDDKKGALQRPSDIK